MVRTRIRLAELPAPGPLAKELLTLDDISEGRITLGIGAGGSGFDATALGQEAWTRRERTDRFAEFVPLLDRLLTHDEVTHEGTYYSAHEARDIPGCVQRPRLPFTVAATGPRGLRLAARYGQSWLTTGEPAANNGGTPADSLAALARQVEGLEKACAETERDPGALGRTLLTGFTPDRPLESVEAFVDFAGRVGELGFDELALHWPIPGTLFEADERVFERIATEGAERVR